MINGMILRENNNILEERSIDLQSQLLLENMNLHIQLFNQKIMNENSYITESKGDKNFIQNAIKIIRSIADKIGTWIVTKVKELKEKIIRLFRKNKSNNSSEKTNLKQSNDANNNSSSKEVWRFKKSDVSIHSMIGDIVIDKSYDMDDILDTIETDVLDQYAFGVKSIDEITPELYITKIEDSNINIDEELKSLEDKLNHYIKVEKAIKDTSSKFIEEFETIYKNMNSSTEVSDTKYFNMNNLDNMNDDDKKSTISKLLELYKKQTGILTKILSAQLSAINQCISHNATL